MCEIKIIGDEILMGGVKIGNLLPDLLPSVRVNAIAKIDGADAEKEWIGRVDELEDAYDCLEIMESVKNGKEKTVPLEAVMKGFRL